MRVTRTPTNRANGTFEAGGNFYYQTDSLGSVTELTDSTDAVARTIVYDSYGRIAQDTGGVDQPFTFTGRELDTESGLYFYRARYYDPATGRFLSEDPIGTQGRDVNLYRSVFNNPVNFVDPLGLEGIYPIPLDGKNYNFPTRCQRICGTIIITCGMAMGFGANIIADLACTTVITPICVWSCENPPEYCDDETNFPEGGA